MADIAAEILAESVTNVFLLVSTSISTSHLSPGVDLHFSPGVDLFFGQSPSSPFTKFSVVRLPLFGVYFHLSLIHISEPTRQAENSTDIPPNNINTENLVIGELGDWQKNRSTPGEKWRSTPGDEWEVEIEVDTRRKASV